MNTQMKVLAGVVVAVVLFLGMSYPKVGGINESSIVAQVVEQVKSVFGGSSGQNHGAHEFFDNGLTQGGAMATTTGLITTYTMQAKDFGAYPSLIRWNNSINQTISLNATSTYALVPNVGDVATVYFFNASTTQAAAITFAASDTGADLQFAEATGGDLVLTGLDYEKMTIIHKTQYQVTFILDEMTEAD